MIRLTVNGAYYQVPANWVQWTCGGHMFLRRDGGIYRIVGRRLLRLRFLNETGQLAV
jgi:hypothetical protein